MLISLLLSLTAHGADLYVETSGADTTDCLSSATPCGTLDHALSQASSGDTVFVGAGIYSSTASSYPMSVPAGVNIQGAGTGLTELVSFDNILLINDATGNQSISDLDFSISGGTAIRVQTFGGSLDLTISNSTIMTRDGLYAAVSSGSGNNHITLDNVDIDAWRTAVELFGTSSQQLTIHNSSISGSDGGIIVGGSSAENSVYVQDALVDSNNLAMQFHGGNLPQSLVVRDSIIGGNIGVQAFLNGDTRIRIDDTSFESDDKGIEIRPSFSDLVLDVRGSDFTDASIAAIDVHASSPSATDIHIRDSIIVGGADGVDIGYDFGTQNTILLDGLTVSNATGTAISVSNSSSSVSTTVLIDRCEIVDNGEGIHLASIDDSVMDATVQRSHIEGSLNDGVHISESGSNDYLLVNNTIQFNASNYANSAAYDVNAVDAGGAVGSVFADHNWWGTTDFATIASHLNQELPIPFSALDTSGLQFDVYPRKGTVSPTELLIEARPGSRLVDYQGNLPTSVLIGGASHPVIWGAPDGSAIRVARGPLSPGVFAVTVNDPSGHGGTLSSTYTVEASPPDDVLVEHEPFILGDGAWVRISGQPHTLGRLFASPLADGPPICHPQLEYNCMQIPLPADVSRFFFTDDSGEALVRIKAPPAVGHPDYIALQAVVGLPGDQRVSPPILHRWLDPTSDADLDGAPDGLEHTFNSDAYGIDSDGDGCLDGEDPAPNTPSGGLINGYPSDCSPF